MKPNRFTLVMAVAVALEVLGVGRGNALGFGISTPVGCIGSCSDSGDSSSDSSDAPSPSSILPGGSGIQLGGGNSTESPCSAGMATPSAVLNPNNLFGPVDPSADTKKHRERAPARAQRLDDGLIPGLPSLPGLGSLLGGSSGSSATQQAPPPYMSNFGVQLPDPCSPFANEPITNGSSLGLQNYFATIGESMMGNASRLFILLMSLDLIWMTFQYFIVKDNLGEFLAQVSLKILSFMFLYYVLLLNGIGIAHVIVNSFIQSTSAQAPDIGSILSQGITAATPAFTGGVALNIVPDEVLGTGFTNLFSSAADTLMAAGTFILLSYVAMATTLLLTIVEAYVVINLGIIVVAFYGSRWTQQYAEKYFAYAINVGVKLMVTYTVIDWVMSDGLAIVQHLGDGQIPPLNFIAVAVGTFMLAGVAYAVPQMASSLTSGISQASGDKVVAGLAQVMASVSKMAGDAGRVPDANRKDARDRATTAQAERDAGEERYLRHHSGQLPDEGVRSQASFDAPKGEVAHAPEFAGVGGYGGWGTGSESGSGSRAGYQDQTGWGNGVGAGSGLRHTADPGSVSSGNGQAAALGGSATSGSVTPVAGGSGGRNGSVSVVGMGGANGGTPLSRSATPGREAGDSRLDGGGSGRDAKSLPGGTGVASPGATAPGREPDSSPLSVGAGSIEIPSTPLSDGGSAVAPSPVTNSASSVSGLGASRADGDSAPSSVHPSDVPAAGMPAPGTTSTAAPAQDPRVGLFETKGGGSDPALAGAIATGNRNSQEISAVRSQVNAWSQSGSGQAEPEPLTRPKL